MQIYRKSLYLFRITIDIIILIISFVISGRESVVNFRFFREVNNQFLLLSLIIIWFFTSRATNLYDEFRSRNVTFEIIALIKNVTVILISSIIILFLLKEEKLSRYFVVIFSVLNIVLLGVEKIAFRNYLNFIRKRGRNLRSLLIVGAGEVGRSFYELIKHSSHFGYQMVGFVDDTTKPYLNGQYLGKIDELDNILNKQHVDDIIIALPNNANERIEDVVTICEKHTTRVRIIPDYFKFVSGKYSVSMFGRFPIIAVREDRINEMHWRLLKRSFDFIFTLSLYLIIFWWLFPLIGLLIKISSPGPMMYRQERWGRNNKRFIAYKFRSMQVDECGEIDENGKFRQATKHDPRVTKVGKFLRKTNLDELPQFWNVLKGDMSIVGPRPHPTPLNIESKDKIRLYMFRHLVKPGITGWAQVNGFRGSTENNEQMQKRVNHDVWYIENWSIWLDVQIIGLTLWNMIKGEKNAY